MSHRPGFLSEVSWLQVAVSALAAVTAAWIASSLGVAGTLIGAALGSSVVTISSAFYGRTLDKGKTLIVQTTSGTVVQAQVDEGEIAEAFEQVEDIDGSPVESAQVVADVPRRLHWKTMIATTVVVLAIALGLMGSYELVTGDSYGSRTDNARIGNPFGGSHDSKDDQKGDDPEPSSTPDPTPTASATTPAPTATTPAPTATTPAPTPTASPTPAPSATTPTPSPTASAPAE